MAFLPRVLFVTHSSKHAGAEVVLCDIAQKFHDTSAVFLFEDGPLKSTLENKNVRVILAKKIENINQIKRQNNLLMAALPMLDSLYSMARQIAASARDFDVIYASSQKAFVISSLASKLANKPLVWHLHDILTVDHFNKMQIKLDVFLASHNTHCKQIIVPSHAAGKALASAGVNKGKINVVHNGINTASIPQSTATRKALRERLNLPSGFIYGVFSRLAPWKGQHIAIKALMHMPDAYCLIVGDAQFGETEYKESLFQLVKDNGLQDRVIFAGHRNDVLQLMQLIDAYCHPSISPEPFGLSIIEAMASKLPVIAVNTGSIPEIVQNRITGLLIEPSSVIDLVTALKLLRSDTLISNSLALAAYDKVKTEFTIEKMQDKISCIVCQVADPHKHKIIDASFPVEF